MPAESGAHAVVYSGRDEHKLNRQLHHREYLPLLSLEVADAVALARGQYKTASCYCRINKGASSLIRIPEQSLIGN